MMDKHTAGPWLMAAKPSSIVGWPIVQQGTGRVICTLNYIQHTQIDPKVPGDQTFNAESRANGKAIEAVPEMLAALRLVSAALGPQHSARIAAEAAIAKAEGRRR